MNSEEGNVDVLHTCILDKSNRHVLESHIHVLYESVKGNVNVKV